MSVVDSLPLVTICVPAYNAEKTLRATIDSLLQQDYANKEIIVCDNASKDNTAKIVKEYEEKGVRYILNPLFGSAEANWNYALDFLSGDLIALYHADDMYSSSMVSSQVNFLLKNPEISSVYTMSVLINENGQLLKPKSKTISSIPECSEETKIFNFKTIFNAVLKHSNFIKTPTLMTRTDVFKIVGKFNLDYKSSADLDLWLRMSKYKPIGIINKPLHKYRISPSQGTTAIYKGIVELPDFYRVTEHYIKTDEQLIEKRSYFYYQMIKGGELILCSLNLLSNNRVKEAKEKLKKALKPKSFLYSFTRKRLFVRYIIGYFLLFAAYLKIGHIMSRFVDFIYQKDKNKWSRPANINSLQ